MLREVRHLGAEFVAGAGLGLSVDLLFERADPTLETIEALVDCALFRE